MQGLHLTSDLTGCDSARPALTDPAVLRRLCLEAVSQAGLVAVGELFHRFVPQPGTDPALAGVTGVVLLAESHLAVHTWPERGAVTLDVYVCNAGADHSGRAEQALEALIAGFAPGHVQRQQLQRGALPARAPQAHALHLDTHLDTHTGPGSTSMHQAREQSP